MVCERCDGLSWISVVMCLGVQAKELQSLQRVRQGLMKEVQSRSKAVSRYYVVPAVYFLTFYVLALECAM